METADPSTSTNPGTGDSTLCPQLWVTPGFSHPATGCKTLGRLPWGSHQPRLNIPQLHEVVNWITKPHCSPAANPGPLSPPIALQSQLLISYIL